MRDMWRSIVLGSVLLLGGQALANGRAPATSTINFRPGMESHIVGGMTFGVVISKDGGATWTWVCEDAVGYGGMYDPDYALTANGALFATTFDGLRVNRDGCVYEASVLSPPQSLNFFSAVEVAANGAIYAASVDGNDGKIYRSTDDGESFPVSAEPGQPNDWWQSLESAPSNPSVVYLAGYRLAAGQPKQFLLFRSSDAGVSFQPLPVDDIATMPNSTIEIAGISATDPDRVYARVVLADNSVSYALYRSTNGGQSWQKINELPGPISFVVRRNGDLVLGTQLLGSFVSRDNGDTWQPLEDAPHISCLTENSAGEVWACTQNYGGPGIPGDGYGIMKTTDLASWTGVLRFQDLKEPEPCPAGTKQKDFCDAQLWCGLCAQLGCTADRDCEVTGDITEPEIKDPSGCCQTGDDAVPGLVALATALGMVVLRRRRGPC
jgi:photosystem II stability/assembly factor-like uncharacterized protein